MQPVILTFVVKALFSRWMQPLNSNHTSICILYLFQLREFTWQWVTKVKILSVKILVGVCNYSFWFEWQVITTTYWCVSKFGGTLAQIGHLCVFLNKMCVSYFVYILGEDLNVYWINSNIKINLLLNFTTNCCYGISRGLSTAHNW